MLQLTLNPGLTLTGFRTTRPRYMHKSTYILYAYIFMVIGVRLGCVRKAFYSFQKYFKHAYAESKTSQSCLHNYYQPIKAPMVYRVFIVLDVRRYHAVHEQAR